MSGQSFVTVVSTRTRDVLPDGQEIPGGPAHYISLAFQKLGRAYRLVTGEESQVEVVMTDTGEEYRVPSVPRIPLPPVLEGEAVMLSPVMHEINPEELRPIRGKLVVDLQGFVRTPWGENWQQLPPDRLRSLLFRADVVKVSEDELSRLDTGSVEALTEALVVVTHGRQGATLRTHGEGIEIPARQVEGVHAIGAGDTFLAAMTHHLLNGLEAVEAATRAARFTEGTLAGRVGFK